jgi:hypothetical protein
MRVESVPDEIGQRVRAGGIRERPQRDYLDRSGVVGTTWMRSMHFLK